MPATGTGYVATTQKTGWPLFTNAYDGAFVAGLYSKEPNPLIPPHDATIAAIPTWSTLKVGTGPDTYSATTPAGQISNFRQTLFLRCGVLRTSLTWTPRANRATDLVYDVIAARNSPHVGAVRMTMTPGSTGRPRSRTSSTERARGGSPRPAAAPSRARRPSTSRSAR